MTVNRRALVSVTIGLGLALCGCSPNAPTSVPPPPPPPTAKVGLTVSSVTQANVAPERFSYVFKLQITESGGVASTVTEVALAFDNGYGDWTHITGNELGENRRLTANGTLSLELTWVSARGYSVGEVFDTYVEVTVTDDNGNRVRAATYVDTLSR